MKIFDFIIICMILLLLSAPVHSADGLYVSGNLGGAMLRDFYVTGETALGIPIDVEFESETGLALGIAVGYGLKSNIRVEGEVAYQKNDIDNVTVSGPARSENLSDSMEGETSSILLLANLYYDITTQSPFTPFVSAGAGLGGITFKLNDDEGDDTVFAYQIGAGVGYAVSATITIDAKYRYLGTSNPEINGEEIKYSSHNFFVGVRTTF